MAVNDTALSAQKH